MKKTINAAIGGCSFVIDDNAYDALSEYLRRFESALGNSSVSRTQMAELEARIADLLKAGLGGREVVDKALVDSVVGQLGYPAGYQPDSGSQNYGQQGTWNGSRPVKKLFRDTDSKMLGGVCSGLALYLDIDVVVVRVLFLIALICGTAGFWIYVIIWIVAPEARTAAEKCEMRGLPVSAENMRRFM